MLFAYYGTVHGRRRTTVLLMALCALGTVLVAIAMDSQSPTTQLSSVAIAIEHASRASVQLLRSTGKNRGVLTASSTSTGAIYLSLPVSWGLREVLGGTIDDVPIDRTAGGYARYALPAGRTVSFWMTASGGVVVHHPSKEPLLLTLGTVDLATGKLTQRTVLMREGIEGWGH
jgi:hypothetical protein